MTEFFYVSKEIEFDAGHRVPLHQSKCYNPHGHRYKVRATVRGPLQEQGPATGMVIDFGDLKKAMTLLIHDVYDHGFIYQDTDSSLEETMMIWSRYAFKIIQVPFAPTAENLARHFFQELASFLPVFMELVQIEVFETPTSVAAYDGGT